MNGVILKAVGGLYTVESPEGLLQCKARGVFRQRGISPCAGDRVEVTGDCIVEILPRKNLLIRPPLANLDQLILVLSTCDPAPNLLLLDKFLAVCVHKQIQPMLVFTKLDLADAAVYAETYRATGFPIFFVDYNQPEKLEQIYDALAEKISAFTGNSGVGKSTLLNALDARLQIETAAISKKLGRGRHTTRTTELYTLENGGKVADTPGFSTFETESYAKLSAEELAECFPDFTAVEDGCRYDDCRHRKEPDCGIRQAVADGRIAQSRYESYLAMLEEILARKEWGKKK